MEYSILKTERIFEGKIFSVRIDEVQKSSGESMRVDIVEHGGAVVIIPIDDDERILLVNQYRHPIGKYLLELPAGTLDESESLEDCAVRECREEVGLAPGRIEHLGGFYLAPGYSTEYLELYLATELHEDPLPQDVDEDLSVKRYSIDEAIEKIRAGELEDAKTIAGLMMLKQYLETKSSTN
jgi:ADP-ribose pyrophosphatase